MYSNKFNRPMYKKTKSIADFSLLVIIMSGICDKVILQLVFIFLVKYTSFYCGFTDTALWYNVENAWENDIYFCVEYEKKGNETMHLIYIYDIHYRFSICFFTLLLYEWDTYYARKFLPG